MLKTESILRPIIRNLGIEEGVRLSRLKRNWHCIFDKPISLHIFPSKISQGKLVVNVDSPLWLQQLSYYKKDILEKLKAYGIKDIYFRIGRIHRSKKTVIQRRDTKELSSDDTLFVAELTGHIEDVTLKDTIQRALEKSLRTRNPARSAWDEK
jgi:hypothetical protein